MPDTCSANPERDCLGLQEVKKVEGEVKALDRRLTEFQQAVSETHSRFGGRIGKLEAHNDVQDEQVKQIKETLMEVKREIADGQKDQKSAIAELRKEHKESMAELKVSNKEILDAVTPLKHKVDAHDISIKDVTDDVEELKEKPGKTWETIKEKGLGWIVALVLAILAVALGLGQYL